VLHGEASRQQRAGGRGALAAASGSGELQHPRAYEPPHLAALKEDLALGRALLPRVLSTVSARPGSPRVAQALGSLQVFDAIETEATAYDASIAAGPAQLVVATNFKVAVLSKTGEPPPVETSLRAWFASGLARGVREGALR
jgi:hypothetical protein